MSGVTVISTVSQQGGAAFPIVLGENIKGVALIVDGATERDAIPAAILRTKQLALLASTGLWYQWDGAAWVAYTGFSGAAGGGGDGFAFTFSATTTDADPGDGFLRLNSATTSAVTSIFVDLKDNAGNTITSWLDSLDDGAGNIKGRVRIQSRSDQTKWAVYGLKNVTSGSGYRKLAVAHIDSSGSLPTTTTGDTFVSFAPGPGLTPIVPQSGAAYTFGLADIESYFRFTNNGSVIATMPPLSSVAWPSRTRIEGIYAGTGSLTFAGGVGVTINKPPSRTLQLAERFSPFCLTNVDDDEWDLAGDLAFA